MRRAAAAFDFVVPSGPGVAAGPEGGADKGPSEEPEPGADTPLNSLRDAEQDVQRLGAGMMTGFAAKVAVAYLAAALTALMLIRSGVSLADVIAILGWTPRSRAPAVDYGTSPPPLSDPGSGEASSGEAASGAWSDG
jgi:hypothetical protein